MSGPEEPVSLAAAAIEETTPMASGTAHGASAATSELAGQLQAQTAHGPSPMATGTARRAFDTSGPSNTGEAGTAPGA